MKTKLCLLLTCFVAYSVFAQEEKVVQNLKYFKELKVFDGISVNLIKSKENKAVITGANTSKVAIVRKGEVLKIRMEIDKIFSGYRTFIDLYYTDELRIIDVNEEARVVSEDTLDQSILELRAQEGGELVVNSNTEQLLIKSISGGRIITEGTSNNQDIIINTGGRYDGRALKTKYTTIKVNAGGNAEVFASDYVGANVKAGGKIFVYGDPTKMDEKKVFGGTIERVEAND